MRKIIYKVIDQSIKGPKVVFASTKQADRDNYINENPDLETWLKPADEIMDLDEVALMAWEKLDGVERLSLLRTDCPLWYQHHGITAEDI